jgi:hypothetical protein
MFWPFRQMPATRRQRDGYFSSTVAGGSTISGLLLGCLKLLIADLSILMHPRQNEIETILYPAARA